MYCSKCGTENENGVKFCTKCGAGTDPTVVQVVQAQPMKHEVPKCTCCGYEGQWKLAPVIRPIDWIITLGLLIFFGAGLVYLLITVVIRSNKDRRSKICPNCKAKNLWTFLY